MVFCVRSHLTETFGTARALSASDVGAGQQRALLPLTLGHTVLQRTSDGDGGVVKNGQRCAHQWSVGVGVYDAQLELMHQNGTLWMFSHKRLAAALYWFCRCSKFTHSIAHPKSLLHFESPPLLRNVSCRSSAAVECSNKALMLKIWISYSGDGSCDYYCMVNVRGSAWSQSSSQHQNTYIAPAVDAFHFPHQRYPGMPVVAVLVIVLAKFAVPRAICLHHVAVLQARGGLHFLWTLLTAVRGITPHRMTAGQHRTSNLLTVYLPRGSLWMQHTIQVSYYFFPHKWLKSVDIPRGWTDEKCAYGSLESNGPLRVLWETRCEWGY